MRLLAVFLPLALGGCAAAPAAVERDAGPASHVLVVVNRDSSASVQVGDYYVRKRKVPRDNVCRINVLDVEEIRNSLFESAVRDPIRNWIRSSKNRIDYIVLTKGVPIRIEEGGYSVDGHLAAMELPIPAIKGGGGMEDQIRRSMNPYFGKSEPFDSRKFKMYLVTRLDGYKVADCLKLVDHALAAKPEKGPFLFNPAANRTGGGYGALQDQLFQTEAALKAKGFTVGMPMANEFAAPAMPIAGYCSWGSNSSAYKREAYLRLRFKPGALAETFVSTSARTLRDPDAPGQSLIGDLIAQGVTGVKGYVSEPFTFALARPPILFGRYTDGFNLAESFYMASPVLKWKDVVIGDPLCAPYGKKR